jgi:hypothetical protein
MAAVEAKGGPKGRIVQKISASDDHRRGRVSVLDTDMSYVDAGHGKDCPTEIGAALNCLWS